MDILIWIVLGGVAGWIAGLIMKTNHNILEDIILGIVGAFIGGFLFGFIGKSGVTGFNLYSLVVAVIGAIVLIMIGRLIHK